MKTASRALFPLAMSSKRASLKRCRKRNLCANISPRVRRAEACTPHKKFRAEILRGVYQFNGTDSASVRFPADHGEVVAIARYGRRAIMKTRTYILSGVAALALAGAAPSFAQTSHDTG